MKSATERRTTNIQLTQKERNTLYEAYNIISEFYYKLAQDTKEEELPVLMSDEDAELIGELGDLAVDTCTTHY